MAQTAAERQSNYRRRQRTEVNRLKNQVRGIDIILKTYADSFCSICHCHKFIHIDRCHGLACDCKGFVRATEPEDTEG